MKNPIPMYITRRRSFILGMTLFEVLIHGKVSTTQNVNKDYRINWGNGWGEVLVGCNPSCPSLPPPPHLQVSFEDLSPLLSTPPPSPPCLQVSFWDPSPLLWAHSLLKLLKLQYTYVHHLLNRELSILSLLCCGKYSIVHYKSPK
jgi:hypothetical protein